ncbi:UNVERIFIED_CONTAM: flagellar basal-body rod modification protein FlgD [Acetivibrio alkalicellulosi]
MPVNGVNHQKTMQEIINMTENKAKERNTDGLGKDDFLNLLIMQLRYQDPLNPVEDKEFIGQMAQFSALEQMQNMNSSFKDLKAFGLIGKNVIASILDEVTREMNLVQGRVESVNLDGGKTFLVVNGRDVPVESIISVEDGSGRYNDGDISRYTALIGHKVEGVVYDPFTADIVGVTGVVMEIQKGRYENYAVMDGVSVNVASIDTTLTSTNPEFRKDYLTNNIGQEVDLIISDDRNREVPVTGILRSFEIAEDGKITAVLDRMLVPVDSIHNIKTKYIQGNNINEGEEVEE